MGSENSPGNFQWDVPGPQCESPEEADEESLKVEDKEGQEAEAIQQFRGW